MNGSTTALQAELFQLHASVKAGFALRNVLLTDLGNIDPPKVDLDGQAIAALKIFASPRCSSILAHKPKQGLFEYHRVLYTVLADLDDLIHPLEDARDKSSAAHYNTAGQHREREILRLSTEFYAFRRLNSTQRQRSNSGSIPSRAPKPKRRSSSNFSHASSATRRTIDRLESVEEDASLGTAVQRTLTALGERRNRDSISSEDLISTDEPASSRQSLVDQPSSRSVNIQLLMTSLQAMPMSSSQNPVARPTPSRLSRQMLLSRTTGRIPPLGFDSTPPRPAPPSRPLPDVPRSPLPRRFYTNPESFYTEGTPREQLSRPSFILLESPTQSTFGYPTSPTFDRTASPLSPPARSQTVSPSSSLVAGPLSPPPRPRTVSPSTAPERRLVPRTTHSERIAFPPVRDPSFAAARDMRVIHQQSAAVRRVAVQNSRPQPRTGMSGNAFAYGAEFEKVKCDTQAKEVGADTKPSGGRFMRSLQARGLAAGGADEGPKKKKPLARLADGAVKGMRKVKERLMHNEEESSL